MACSRAAEDNLTTDKNTGAALNGSAAPAVLSRENRTLLLNLDVEAGVVERLDHGLGVEIAGHYERLLFGLGGVAGDAVNLLDGGLDRLVAVAAAVMDTGEGERLDLAGGDAAVVLHLQVLVAGVAVEAAGGQGV